MFAGLSESAGVINRASAPSATESTPQGKGLRMSRKRVNKYPIAFRQMALERMKNCASVSALAEELGVHRTVLYHWATSAASWA